MAQQYQFGVLGYPLTHSLSPTLHQLFFEHSGFSGDYRKLEIPPGQFQGWLDHWRHHGLHGFNVTIPYKVQILPYLKHLSDDALLLEAVNTVVLREDGLYGDNTDAYGFLAPLSPEILKNLADSSVLIMGAGGASRAVVGALLNIGVSQISFWVRNPDTAQETISLARAMSEQYGRNPDWIELYTDMPPERMVEYQMVVNTTPVGMAPNTNRMLLDQPHFKNLDPDTLIYDLVYNPIETLLLKTAKEYGLQTQDGLSMLIHQGAKAFELWTGHALSTDSLTDIRDALSRLRFSNH